MPPASHCCGGDGKGGGKAVAEMAKVVAFRREMAKAAAFRCVHLFQIKSVHKNGESSMILGEWEGKGVKKRN
tara:strand:+ start:58 stop:273 length:216 start_codon:yes stop_codon:yes gene_type:complete